MPPRLIFLYRKLGRIEKTFLLLVLLAVVLAYVAPASFFGLPSPPGSRAFWRPSGWPEPPLRS
jgi:hypothetical protein